MTVEELIILGTAHFHKDKIKLLLGQILNINPLELNLFLHKKVSKQEEILYKKSLELLKEGLPLQYVLNNTCFYGYNYYVNKDVLIPRFETEELVHNTIIFLKRYFNNPKVLDLCAGSGCIGLTLKLEMPDIKLSLSDISESALNVLKINKEKYNINADVFKSDLFNNIDSKYDCIISNPPYVSYDDSIDDIVKKNEPSIALYAKNNGLEYYEKIFKNISSYLNNKYLIALEIGSNQKDSVISIINENLKNIKIIPMKDASDRDRMIFVLGNIE